MRIESTHLKNLVTVSTEECKHMLYGAGTDPLLSCRAQLQTTLIHIPLEKYPRKNPGGLSKPHACWNSSPTSPNYASSRKMSQLVDVTWNAFFDNLKVTRDMGSL